MMDKASLELTTSSCFLSAILRVETRFGFRHAAGYAKMSLTGISGRPAYNPAKPN